jgi:hypothetical protein
MLAAMTGARDRSKGMARRLHVGGGRLGTVAYAAVSVLALHERGWMALVGTTALSMAVIVVRVVAHPQRLVEWLTEVAEIPEAITTLIDAVRAERPRWRRRTP